MGLLRSLHAYFIGKDHQILSPFIKYSQLYQGFLSFFLLPIIPKREFLSLKIKPHEKAQRMATEITEEVDSVF